MNWSTTIKENSLMARKKKPNVVTPRCIVCKLDYTGETGLVGSAVRQGMSDQESLKFDKRFKLKCRRCGRGSWTIVPPPHPVKGGPNIPLLDAIENQLSRGEVGFKHDVPDIVLDAVRNGNK